MKFTVESKAFKQAVRSLAKFAPARSPLPFLQSLRLRASDGSLLLEACDATAWVGTTLTAQVEEEGELLVEASVLAKYVATCESDELSAYFDGKALFFKWGSDRFKVGWLFAEDWPTFQDQAWVTHEIPSEMLQSGIASIINAYSPDRVEAWRNCIYLHTQDGELRVACGSSPKICRKRIGEFKGELSIAFPKSAADWILEMPDAGALEVSSYQGMFRLSDGKSYYFGSQIACQYPPIDRALARRGETFIEVEREPFIDLLKRACLIGSNLYRATFMFANDELIVYAEEGQNSFGGKISATCCDESTRFAANAHFLLTGCQAISSEMVRLYANMRTPIAVTVPERDDWLMLVMPMEYREVEIAA